MAPMTIDRVGWTLRIAGAKLLRLVGWGGVGILFCLVALGAAWAVQHHWQRRLSGEERAAVQRAAAPPVRAAPAPLSLDQELRAFEARLPGNEEAMQVLAKLFVLAEKHKLAMSRGEYRSTPDPGGGLQRFQMTFPLKGEPRTVQRFIHEALLSQPTLAFDSLVFKRDKVETPMVEAKVQFTLIMRPAIPGKSIPATTPASPKGPSP